MYYRSLPRISNSDLTEFHNFLFGIDRPNPVQAFSFGTLVHSLVLESKKTPEIPENVDYSLAEMIARQARNDSFTGWVLRFGRKEQVVLWNDPATGLLLKSQLDITHKKQLVVDLKTTGERSYSNFLRSCERYDYDRQAAFYLDAVGAKKFVFVAVQKVKPFNIWTIEHHSNSPFIEAGRKKYKALLREWKRRELAGQPFVPSRWNVNIETELAPC